MASFTRILAWLVLVSARRADALRQQHEQQVRSSQGTINFLFMLRDTLPHPDVWLSFFDRAPRNSWRAWAHCTHLEECQTDKLLHRLGVKFVSTAPTKWCDDLVTAQAHLVEAALRDSPGTPGVLDKFVMLSDSTLPIRPFAAIYKGLMATEESSICMRPIDEWPRASINGTEFRLVKHSQWVVLNRKDAQEFVRQWPPSPELNQWDMPLMGIDGQPDWSQSVNRSQFWPTDGAKAGGGRCPDEEAIWALLYGAPASTDVLEVADRSRCHTYIEWKGTFMWLHGITPRVFQTVEDDVLMAAVSDGPFYFARKYASNAEVPELLNILQGLPIKSDRIASMRSFLESWGDES